MANLSIKSKLLVMLLAVSLFSIAVVASLNYYTCYKALQEAVFSHLTSVRASRADQIEQFIERLRKETRVIGGSAVSSGAARAFIDAYRKLDDVTVDPATDAGLRQFYSADVSAGVGESNGYRTGDQFAAAGNAAARYLQYQYLAKNPFPIGENGLDDEGRRCVGLLRATRDSFTRRCGESCSDWVSSMPTSIDIETAPSSIR